MAVFQGFNPYGGYGVPTQMAQPMYPQAAQQTAYTNQQQMMAQSQQMQQPSVTVRLVTNYNEADAAQIPFDSTMNLFVNMAAGEIYMKRFDPNSGRAPIIVFRQEQMQTVRDAPEQQEYATIQSLQALEQRVNELAETMSIKRTRSVKTDE